MKNVNTNLSDMEYLKLMEMVKVQGNTTPSKFLTLMINSSYDRFEQTGKKMKLF